MASITRNKIYVFLIGILLLSNLALVAFFVLNKPAKKEIRRERPSSYMKEALKDDVGFNDQQMAQYEEMVGLHRQQMRPLFEDISKTKESFYHMLTKPETPDTVLNNAAREIGDKQKHIDLKIFMHFQNIRQLSTPEQQPKLDSLIQKVVHKMVFPMRKGEGKKDSTSLRK